jgi:hypothetical protein
MENVAGEDLSWFWRVGFNNWRFDQGSKCNQIRKMIKTRVIITVEISKMPIPVILDVKTKKWEGTKLN